MTLLPRKFKIEHELLDNKTEIWYAVWQNAESDKKWAIQYGANVDGLMTTSGFYNYLGPDTMLFDTAKEAAEYVVKMRGQKPKIS